jgi:hypothetical protein
VGRSSLQHLIMRENCDPTCSKRPAQGFWRMVRTHHSGVLLAGEQGSDFQSRKLTSSVDKDFGFDGKF